MADFALEAALLRRNRRYVCGLDEVGRGCLFGPVVAGAVAVPMAFFTPDPAPTMLLTLALYVVAFTVSGYVLDPLVVGKKVGIGAVLLILSVLIGLQFGIVWAFLAVPIAAVIKVIALQVERFYRRSPIYLGLGKPD